MTPIVIVISATIEWRAVRQMYPTLAIQRSPLGEWAEVTLTILSHGAVQRDINLILLHGGWGKIAAAASTQYLIDRWSPQCVVNLGTCGGFAGEIERGAVILANRTLVYDIIEQMYDQAEHIAHYTTTLDLSWLATDAFPQARRDLLISADRDLIAEQISELKRLYGAIAGDWESGAIAWVCARNKSRCLILRGVSDLVAPSGGEAYHDETIFEQGVEHVMAQLMGMVVAWLDMLDINRLSAT